MATLAHALVWAALLAVAAVFATVGVRVRGHSDVPGRTSFVGFCLAIGIFVLVFTVMQVVGTFIDGIVETITPTGLVVLTAFVVLTFFVSGLVAPLLFVRFALVYTGQQIPTTRRTFLVVGAPVLVVVAILLATIPVPWLESVFGVDLALFSDELLDYSQQVTVLYLFVLLVAGASLIGWTSYTYRHLTTRGGILLGVGAVLPWAAVAIPQTTGLIEGMVRQTNAAGWGVLGASALLAALYRDDLFENVPAAGTIGRDVTVEEMNDPVVVVDQACQIVDLNRAAERLFDVSASAVGTPLAALFDSEIDVETMLTDGSDQFEVGPERRIVEASGSRLTDEHDHTLGYSVVFHDVTERETREQRLQVLNRVLRHNLRNDMTAVNGYAELLEERTADPDDCAARIQELSRDLLEIGEKARDVESVVAAGPEQPTLPLAEVLQQAVEEIRPAYPDCRIRVEIGPGAGDCGVVGPVMTALLRELVDNGLRHNDGDDRWVAVEATVEETGEYPLTVTVTDNGTGIPDHEVAPIKAGNETAVNHGSGLGLWLVEWSVRRLNGCLMFDENEPRGTVATLRFRPSAGSDGVQS
jgi:PAS domain S-box-containing protein